MRSTLRHQNTLFLISFLLSSMAFGQSPETPSPGKSPETPQGRKELNIPISSELQHRMVQVPLVAPAGLDESAEFNMTEDDIKELRQYAWTTKTKLEALLSDVNGMDPDMARKTLCSREQKIFDDSAEKKGRELPLRDWIGRTLHVADYMNAHFDFSNWGTIDFEVRFLKAAVAKAIEYYQPSINYIDGVATQPDVLKSGTQTVALGLDFATFLTEQGEMVLNAGVQYEMEVLALKILDWDLKRDDEHNAYAPAIVDTFDFLSAEKLLNLKSDADYYLRLPAIRKAYDRAMELSSKGSEELKALIAYRSIEAEKEKQLALKREEDKKNELSQRKLHDFYELAKDPLLAPFEKLLGDVKGDADLEWRTKSFHVIQDFAKTDASRVFVIVSMVTSLADPNGGVETKAAEGLSEKNLGTEEVVVMVDLIWNSVQFSDIRKAVLAKMNKSKESYVTSFMIRGLRDSEAPVRTDIEGYLKARSILPEHMPLLKTAYNGFYLTSDERVGLIDVAMRGPRDDAIAYLMAILQNETRDAERQSATNHLKDFQ